MTLMDTSKYRLLLAAYFIEVKCIAAAVLTNSIIQVPTFVPIYKNRLDCKVHYSDYQIHIWTTRSIAVMTEEIQLTYALVGGYCFSCRQKWIPKYQYVSFFSTYAACV